eukprot:Gregarina_sp_Poly_1__702@NODE_1168_length_4874_cov_154_360100_g625_i2_p2_GENE_NODE_1168_length_4874_cov_154_360100_g625_i2NODE_1168_length_4874_cov_154_360100_g625_i2_p2_ORF_typecomplete_len400_score40_88_NODE_1168_length_4874_cov_154_360100_g625_i2281227
MPIARSWATEASNRMQVQPGSECTTPFGHAVHSHSWDRTSAFSRFSARPSSNSLDAALVAVASSLLSMQSKDSSWSHKPHSADSPIYLSDASTRAASLSRPTSVGTGGDGVSNPVDALIAELVSNQTPHEFGLERNKQTASASVCRSTFFDRESFTGLDWTPPCTPTVNNVLTLEGGLSSNSIPASIAMSRTQTVPSRTRTFSYCSPSHGGLLAEDGPLSLLPTPSRDATLRMPAASYQAQRRSFHKQPSFPLQDLQTTPAPSHTPDTTGSRLRRLSSNGSAQPVSPPDENLSALRELKLEALLRSFNLVLDNTHNAVVHLPDCVKTILPLTAEGEVLSVGSLLHYSGGCRNCIFNSGRQGCHNGLNCVFCHHSHPRPKRRSRRRVAGGGSHGKTAAEQ